MRKILLFLIILASLNVCFAQETEADSFKASKGGISEIPAAKRPKPIDQEKAAKAAEKDESEKDYENKSNTIKYGIPSEISALIDELIKNDDPRFTEEIYDVFQVSKNTVIMASIIGMENVLSISATKIMEIAPINALPGLKISTYGFIVLPLLLFFLKDVMCL